MQACIKISKVATFTFMLLALLTIFLGFPQPSYATMAASPVPVPTETIETSTHYSNEYYKIRTPFDEPCTIYVEGHTKVPTKKFCIRLKNHSLSNYPITVFVIPDSNGDFSIKINTTAGNTTPPEIIDGKGKISDTSYSSSSPGKTPVKVIPEGIYHLTIARATNDTDAKVFSTVLKGSSNYGYAYKEALLTVMPGHENNPKLIKYNDVIYNNKLVRNYTVDGATFLNTNLKDLKFVLRDPLTETYEYLTNSQIAYIKDVANEITAGADSDYNKLEKIYEYVSSNVYYDNYAFTTGKRQYANPYLNLYNMRNNINSPNCKDGKVATTCQGYSAMVIALARAEGIPARLVYGNHISQPTKIWAQIAVDQIQTRSHWWSEAYVDGRWVIIDANAATYNKWYRDSFSDAGTYKYSGTSNYSHFDPTIEQFSSSYSYNGIYHYGSHNIAYKEYTSNVQPDIIPPDESVLDTTVPKVNLTKNHEIKQLRKFLNLTASGITNGKRLNNKYSAYTFSTWSNGVKNNFVLTDGGRVQRIAWYKESLVGTLDLSDFAYLNKLVVYTNRLTALNLDNCSNLTYISASYNRLTSFNSTDSRKTTYINLKGNELTNAKFWYVPKKRAVTIKTNTNKADFGMKYDASKKKKITIYAKKINGYTYKGIYNDSTGKRISKKLTYTFNPASKSYTVKYSKKK